MGMKRGILGVVGFAGLWVLLTAVLAPAVRSGVEALAPGVYPFARIFGRVQLGVALALVPGLLFFWRQDPRRFLEVGRWKRQGLRMGLWAGLGVGMLGLVALGQSGLGVRRWGGVPGWGGVVGGWRSGNFGGGIGGVFLSGGIGVGLVEGDGGAEGGVAGGGGGGGLCGGAFSAAGAGC